jgi:transcriptional regulator with XRE-family HTH domain
VENRPVKKAGVPSAQQTSFEAWARSATVGDRIRWLIEARGYKQIELAQKMDLTQATISNWLTGASRKPNAPSLLKLAAALQCNPQFIVDGTGDPWQMNVITRSSEQDLLESFRRMDPNAQAALLAAARAMEKP